MSTKTNNIVCKYYFKIFAIVPDDTCLYQFSLTNSDTFSQCSVSDLQSENCLQFPIIFSNKNKTG